MGERDLQRWRELLKRREASRGLLDAFEGPDGSGKTTQRKLFKQWLKSEGVPVTTTRWNSSPLIKPLVKVRKQVRAMSPEEFCFLHAADFRHRLETEVLPALWQGTTVVADRYLFTALARDAARGLPFDWLLNVYSPILWPDVVFYLSYFIRRPTARLAPSDKRTIWWIPNIPCLIEMPHRAGFAQSELVTRSLLLRRHTHRTPVRHAVVHAER
jgi:thymidylate kinase